MSTFATRNPIHATVDINVGTTWIVASDRTDTVVEVRPVDAGNKLDVKAADQTRVEYANGELLVKQPTQLGLLNKYGTVEVSIALPTGSTLSGKAGVGGFRCEGRFGECRVRSGTGEIQLDRTGTLHANTAAGDITVDAVEGQAELTTSSGDVRVREVDSGVVVKNSNGNNQLGAVAGDVKVRAANGDIAVGSAGGTVELKSANGDLRLDEVVRGSAVLETTTGDIEIGVREGTAAWLDLRATAGTVRNSLDRSDGPAATDETVKVRARTYTGDIVIQRA